MTCEICRDTGIMEVKCLSCGGLGYIDYPFNRCICDEGVLEVECDCIYYKKTNAKGEGRGK
jgi:hypothetical protein